MYEIAVQLHYLVVAVYVVGFWILFGLIMNSFWE